MNITLICGSHRNGGSTKVADFLETRLKAKGITTSKINLSEANIPLRSPDRWNADADVHNILNPLREPLEQADGFVIISPERSGMVAPGLKNFFLIGNSDKGEFAHKPALITTVSSGTGGAYPVAELRMSSYKNTKLNYIPDHLIIRDVENVFNTHDLQEGKENDIRIKQRADRSLDVLVEYTKAMSPLRKQTDIDLLKHGYGM